VIWIDAICINQNDVQERNEQVGMMGDIYRKCTDVVAWLGDGGGEDHLTIEEGISIFEPYFEGGDFSEKAESKLCLSHQETRDIVQSFAILYLAAQGKHLSELAKSYRTENQMLQSILQAPYWDRVWVVQEMVFPPLATVYFGPVGTRLEILFEASNQFRIHEKTCCVLKARNHHDHNQNHLRRMLRHDLVVVLSLQETRQALLIEGYIGNAVWVLQSYCPKKSTDPRDKIYAILSLVNNWHGHRPIVPDYSLSLSELLQITSLFNLNTNWELPTNCMIDPNLPSWVSDWSKTCSVKDKAELWSHSNSVLFTASLPTFTEDVVSKALPNALLMMKASRVDTVNVVRQSMNFLSDNGLYDDLSAQVAYEELSHIRSKINRVCISQELVFSCGHFLYLFPNVWLFQRFRDI
jgi:hypothetical protein